MGKEVKRRLYELYQLDWMQRHGHGLSDLVDALGGYEEEIMEDNSDSERGLVYEAYDGFLDGGFNGELFASFPEFLDDEYLDEPYMKELCDVVGDGDELYEAYVLDLEGRA